MCIHLILTTRSSTAIEFGFAVEGAGGSEARSDLDKDTLRGYCTVFFLQLTCVFPQHLGMILITHFKDKKAYS